MSKLITLDPLYSAQVLVRNMEASRTQLEQHLAPFLAQYIEFRAEISPNYYDDKDKEADTFIQTDNDHFVFEGESYWDCGDFVTPTVELPFAFVEDPQAFMNKARADKLEADAKYAAANEQRAKDRIDLLRRQLAVAEAALTKAEADGDLIKATSTRNQIDNLKEKE